MFRPIITLLAGCVLALGVGGLATQPTSMVVQVVAPAIALAVIFKGPHRLIVWLAGTGVLVTQVQWPLVTSVGGADIYLGDMLALVAVAGAVVQPNARPLWRLGVALIAALGVWAILRSGAMGEVAFGRILLPLFAMGAVARVLPDGYDLRRDLRWFPVAVLVSVPLVDGLASSRWNSIAGGANETGLIGALAIGLGFSYRGPWRLGMWLIGAALLFGSAGITATIAAGSASLYWATARRSGERFKRLGSASPVLVISMILVAAFTVPILRLDVAGTIDAHLFQTSSFTKVITDGDAFYGSGWTNVDVSAFASSDILGLHNVYLDVFAYLGVVGFALFAGLLVAIWKRTDVVGRTLLLAWGVWINTTGAFPGTAWGVLGFLVTMAALGQPSSDEAAEERGDNLIRGTAKVSRRRPHPGRGRIDADLEHADRGS